MVSALRPRNLDHLARARCSSLFSRCLAHQPPALRLPPLMMIGTGRSDPERRQDRLAHLAMLCERLLVLGAHRLQLRDALEVVFVEAVGDLIEVAAGLAHLRQHLRQQHRIGAGLRRARGPGLPPSRLCDAIARGSGRPASAAATTCSRKSGVQRVVSQALRGSLTGTRPEMPPALAAGACRNCCRADSVARKLVASGSRSPAGARRRSCDWRAGLARPAMQRAAPLPRIQPAQGWSGVERRNAFRRGVGRESLTLGVSGGKAP